MAYEVKKKVKLSFVKFKILKQGRTNQGLRLSIFYTRLIRRSGRGGELEPIPAVIGREVGYTVDSPSQGHTETNETNNHAHA